MTDAEDARNAELGERMKTCQHEPVRTEGNGVVCTKCGGRFALMLPARKASVYPINPADYE